MPARPYIQDASNEAMSPTSSHVPRLSFGQTSAAAPVAPGHNTPPNGAPMPPPRSPARAPVISPTFKFPSPAPSPPSPPEHAIKHRPSLSKFTFPARSPELFVVKDNHPSAYEQARPEPTELGPEYLQQLPSFFNQGQAAAAAAANAANAAAGKTPYGISSKTHNQAASAERESAIQFRGPFPQPRPTVRTLYSGATMSSSRFAADPAYSGSAPASPGAGAEYGRRQKSIIKAEEYMPGLPAGSNAGKAANAGFQRSESDVSARMREARASIASLRKVSSASLPAYKAAMSSQESLKRHQTLDGHQETDADLGDIGSLNEKSDLRRPLDAEDQVVMPTVYYNSSMDLGPIAFDGSVDEKRPHYGARKSSIVPRDPVTGRVDWRARLSMKPRSSISLEWGDKSLIFDSDSKGASIINEKARGGFLYAEGKPTPLIVDIENDRYTALGRALLRASPATFVLSQVATGFYLYLRARSILRANSNTGSLFLSAWLFYAFEAVFALFIGLRALYKVCNVSFEGTRRYLLQGDFALPNVDVLVLATGQDPSMVIDAVIAAARLDWPVDKLRVLLIDETRSNTIKSLAQQYANTRAIHVTYHCRGPNAQTPRGDVWPKSSTINFGLAETRAEGRIAGEYTVVLEAESLAESGMLRALLPHLVENPVLALVQSPSAFYNLPNKLSSAFATYIGCVEPVQDSRSAFAVRRSAIDDIGGFPTKSSIEDKRLEMLLKGKGYSTLFLDEPLQYSMAPDSFSKHLRQRVDRSLAHFKTYLRLGFYMFSFQLSELSFGQRLIGTGRGLAPFLSIIIALTSIALPMALAFGGFLIPALSLVEINMMLWAALAMILTEKLHDFCFAMPSGEKSTRRYVRSQVFMAPYLVLGMVRSLIPGFLCRAPETYWVAKEAGTPTERNSKARSSLGKRLLAVTFGSHGWTHLLMVCAILGTIGYSLFCSIAAFARGQRGLHQTALYVLMTVAWPTLPWMDLLLGSLTPFIYALFPPTVASREALLTREPISGRASPHDSCKGIRPFRTSFWGQTILSTFVVVYACAVFALTFVDLHVK